MVHWAPLSCFLCHGFPSGPSDVVLWVLDLQPPAAAAPLPAAFHHFLQCFVTTVASVLPPGGDSGTCESVLWT